MSERIPFTTQPLSRKPCSANGHDRRPRTGSGIWRCKLTTITPLTIHALFRNLAENENAYLPGSSLRGMVRNVVEMLGAGCGRFYDRPSPPLLATCTRDATCISCRLFGFVESDSGWAGKVRFEDTVTVPVRWERHMVPTQRPPQAPGSGWLIFPCTRPQLEPGPIRCAPAGTEFRFRVDYTNLNPEEYAVLKFALTLTHGAITLCHTLGYGKALGFGACKIELLQDRSPAIGPEITTYLNQLPFEALANYRRRP
ncbi:MAG: hypothetical protein LAO78_11205 [Acidobacteriia bacterium]|nr:hypothetical protein [Terriglobia bacterium]